MTDEEKAEEYLKNLDDCRTKELMKQAYLDGLAEGRKEGKESKIGLIKFRVEQKVFELEKQNERLSKMLEMAFGDLCSECSRCPNWNNIDWVEYRAELEKRVENEK